MSQERPSGRGGGTTPFGPVGDAMVTEANRARSAFSWNAGGWFGSQLGGTLWLLILGLALLSKDSFAAWACLASFAALNAWGLVLWRRRGQLPAYAGLQWFLLAVSVVVAFVVVVVNRRGVAEPATPGAWVSTHLPYGAIAVAPLLMAVFFWREWIVRRSQG